MASDFCLTVIVNGYLAVLPPESFKTKAILNEPMLVGLKMYFPDYTEVKETILLKFSIDIVYGSPSGSVIEGSFNV